MYVLRATTTVFVEQETSTHHAHNYDEIRFRPIIHILFGTRLFRVVSLGVPQKTI